MDSFELNKLFGALLSSVLFIMGLGILSNVVFSTESPEVMGYQIDIADADLDEDGTEEEESVIEPITIRLASADNSAGEKVAKKCAACHTFESAGANKVGPNLWGIVKRTPAAVSDFKYSSKMTEFAEGNIWTFENLDLFLEKPSKFLKGTSMAFAGLRKPEDRADMIEYLRNLSDSPVPISE